MTNPRDNHCFRENPGHYNHEEPEVKWAYIHRASEIFWFRLSLWDSFWCLFWGVNVYLHFTKIKIKYVYFSIDTHTCVDTYIHWDISSPKSVAVKLVRESAPCAGLVETGIPGPQPLSFSSWGVCMHVCVHVCACACMCSILSDSVTLWTEPARLLCQWNFPGKKHCSGLPLPLSGDLPNPGIKRQTSFVSCVANSLPLCHSGSP